MKPFMIREIIFKLKHDIANDSELPLAAMELGALFGSVGTAVKNLADLLIDIDWFKESVACHGPSRVQDILLRLPYPGAWQGYRIAAESLAAFSVQQIARLTYFRDVFVLFSGHPSETLARLGLATSRRELSPSGLLSPTGCRLSPVASLHQLEAGKHRFLLRIIAHHCFLECSDHVVRLAQKPQDVDRMYDGMLKHLQDNYFRAFAASVQMGYKWIEDFIDDRRPPNAYASHSLFGLRGRFFPRMVRALSNHLSAKAGVSAILDPFGGVGTLGIECSLLGIGSKSYDLNPFFVQVSQAKHHALNLSKTEMAQLDELRDYAQEMRMTHNDNGDEGRLFDSEVLPVAVAIPRILSRAVKGSALNLVATLRGKIEATCSPKCANVAMLALAYYANSMLKKYSREKTLRCFWAHLSRILYLARFMNRLYADDIVAAAVAAEFRTGNIKELSRRENDVQAIMTSPPYTTAIDYLGNDAMAYYATGLGNHEKIEAEMIGSTRLGRVASDNARTWSACVPATLKKSHALIGKANPKKAVCLAKYFHDMSIAFKEIAGALAVGGRMGMVVCGAQEFGVARAKVQYNVADGIISIGEKAGLVLDQRIDVDLTKNGEGNIRQEAVLLFSK